MAKSRQRISDGVAFFFLGNYFYGVCVIVLSMEASLEQGMPLNSLAYYVLVFAATVLFYTIPYVARFEDEPEDPRSGWYPAHRRFLSRSMVLMVVLVVSAAMVFFVQYGAGLLQQTALDWMILLVFPLLALAYYGPGPRSPSARALRHVGWLKPFVIGLVWAGLVTVYPPIFAHMENGGTFQPGPLQILLLVKNGMYVSMLAILFDFKDRRSDHRQRLMTFVVLAGLYETIFFIVVPMSALGLVIFVYYDVTHVFHLMKIVLDVAPFLLVVLAAVSVLRPRSTLYYFVVIDGLLFVKAVCGILATLYP